MTEVESNSGTKSRVRKRRIGRRWALAGAALLFGWFCFYFLVPPSFDQEPMPEPNGYEYFIRAGNMVSYDRNLMTNDNDLAWSRPIYDSNQLALAEFRRGMEFECRVPRLPTDEDSWQSFFHEMRSVMQLVTVLRAQAVILKSAERHEQAARCGMELIRFGHKTRRGGVVLNAMTSNAAILSGGEILQMDRHHLDARTLRSLCGELLELDANRESYDEILTRDRKVNRAIHFRLEDIPDRLKESVDFKTKRQIRFHQVSARTRSRLLIVELALEAFLKERGAYPRELADLTPDILKAVPLDLFGNKEFGYVRNADGYLLYSYGPDGVDDGGASIDSNSARKPKGDVTFERW